MRLCHHHCEGWGRGALTVCLGIHGAVSYSKLQVHYACLYPGIIFGQTRKYERRVRNVHKQSKDQTARS